MAGFVQKITGSIVLAGVALQKGDVVSVRYETDILTVMLPGCDEAMLRGDGPDLRLGQIAQRKQGVGKHILGQAVEKVGLILGSVRGLIQ